MFYFYFLGGLIRTQLMPKNSNNDSKIFMKAHFKYNAMFLSFDRSFLPIFCFHYTPAGMIKKSGETEFAKYKNTKNTYIITTAFNSSYAIKWVTTFLEFFLVGSFRSTCFCALINFFFFPILFVLVFLFLFIRNHFFLSVFFVNELVLMWTTTVSVFVFILTLFIRSYHNIFGFRTHKHSLCSETVCKLYWHARVRIKRLRKGQWIFGCIVDNDQYPTTIASYRCWRGRRCHSHKLDVFIARTRRLEGD